MNQGLSGRTPYEKVTVPLTEAEIRYIRNQYKILLVLPALFVGLGCITWYYNPPASVKDWIYATALFAGIATATYFITKGMRKKAGSKAIIRGVILGKRKQGMGNHTKYYLKVGEEEVKVIESDFNTYESGDYVQLEIFDEPLFWRPRISLLP